MATAKVTTETVTLEKVILELDKDEAKALQVVLSFVAGNPRTTRRGLIQDISMALVKAGFQHASGDPDVSGSIYFTEC